MKFLKLIFFLALPVFSAFSQDLYISTKAGPFTPFQQIRPSNHIRDYPIPYIGGNWNLVGLNTSESTGAFSGIPLSSTYLVDVRDGKFFASVNIQANLEERGGASDWTDEPCKRDDMLWKRSTGGKFSRINCAAINHLTNFYIDPTGNFQNHQVVLKAQSIELPQVVIAVHFTRFDNRGRRLRYEFNFNPELMGIEKTQNTNWNQSPWHKNYISKDPRRAEFIDSLTKWATDFQNKMEAAFEKRKDVFLSVPPMASYLSMIELPKDKITNSNSNSNSNSNIESKIRLLKELVDKKLITEQQFEIQVKELLSGN